MPPKKNGIILAVLGTLVVLISLFSIINAQSAGRVINCSVTGGLGAAIAGIGHYILYKHKKS